METLVQVLTDGFFTFKQTQKHTTKRLRTSLYKDEPTTIKVLFKHFSIHVRSAFTSDILVCTLTFHPSPSVSLYDARSIASTISHLPSTVDVPKLHLKSTEDDGAANKPDKIEWMCKGHDEYKLATLLLVLSNFPNNVFDNEIL